MGTCKGVQGDGNSELWDTLRDSFPSPQLHPCALREYYFCVVLRGGPGVHAGRAVIYELPRWGLTTVLRPRPWAHRGAGKTAVLGSFWGIGGEVGSGWYGATACMPEGSWGE
mgnify:CR=1 FL=1